MLCVRAVSGDEILSAKAEEFSDARRKYRVCVSGVAIRFGVWVFVSKICRKGSFCPRGIGTENND